MKNKQMLVKWLSYTFYTGGFGVVTGFFVALALQDKKSDPEILFLVPCWLALVLGAIPAGVSAWYLLLVMLGQVSSAVKNEDDTRDGDK